MLRSVNVLPDSTGHTASDSSALGMRLMAAAASGREMKLRSGVSASGV